MSNFKFELYISGDAPANAQVITDLKDILDLHLNNRYELEIIDVLIDAERAKQAHIITQPTLIKISPEPVCRLIGGLSIKSRVLAGLHIAVLTDYSLL